MLANSPKHSRGESCMCCRHPTSTAPSFPTSPYLLVHKGACLPSMAGLQHTAVVRTSQLLVCWGCCHWCWCCCLWWWWCQGVCRHPSFAECAPACLLTGLVAQYRCGPPRTQLPPRPCTAQGSAHTPQATGVRCTCCSTYARIFRQ